MYQALFFPSRAKEAKKQKKKEKKVTPDLRLTLILQHVHVKRNVFTLYQEEYFIYVFMGMLS